MEEKIIDNSVDNFTVSNIISLFSWMIGVIDEETEIFRNLINNWNRNKEIISKSHKNSDLLSENAIKYISYILESESFVKVKEKNTNETYKIFLKFLWSFLFNQVHDFTLEDIAGIEKIIEKWKSINLLEISLEPDKKSDIPYSVRILLGMGPPSWQDYLNELGHLTKNLSSEADSIIILGDNITGKKRKCNDDKDSEILLNDIATIIKIIKDTHLCVFYISLGMKISNLSEEVKDILLKWEKDYIYTYFEQIVSTVFTTNAEEVLSKENIIKNLEYIQDELSKPGSFAKRVAAINEVLASDLPEIFSLESIDAMSEAEIVCGLLKIKEFIEGYLARVESYDKYIVYPSLSEEEVDFLELCIGAIPYFSMKDDSELPNIIINLMKENDVTVIMLKNELKLLKNNLLNSVVSHESTKPESTNLSKPPVTDFFAQRPKTPETTQNPVDPQSVNTADQNQNPNTELPQGSPRLQ